MAKQNNPPKEEKNKGGRPKENVSDKVDISQVEKLAELGHTDAEIGWILGKDESTINRWKADPEFLQALKRGKAIADSKVVQSLYNRAIGFERAEVKIFQYEGSPVLVPFTAYYPPDTTAQIFWLKNRQPDRWRDKQEIYMPDGVDLRSITILPASQMKDNS